MALNAQVRGAVSRFAYCRRKVDSKAPADGSERPAAVRDDNRMAQQKGGQEGGVGDVGYQGAKSGGVNRGCLFKSWTVGSSDVQLRGFLVHSTIDPEAGT